MRKYQPIWSTLKAKEKAEVTVSEDNLVTVIQAVKKLKTEENTASKALDKVGWSKLKITRIKLSDKWWKVIFEFQYSSDI